MYACMYVCMYACMYACMHVCMYACMYVWMYGVYIYICVDAWCMYVIIMYVFFHLSIDLSIYVCVAWVYINDTYICTHTFSHMHLYVCRMQM